MTYADVLLNILRRETLSRKQDRHSAAIFNTTRCRLKVYQYFADLERAQGITRPRLFFRGIPIQWDVSFAT